MLTQFPPSMSWCRPSVLASTRHEGWTGCGSPSPSADRCQCTPDPMGRPRRTCDFLMRSGQDTTGQLDA
uniref:Uncharacterized protein n=1 Tax=uncultured Acidobacteria bacterium HF4000_26D02 TaxID=710731 RepID=E0XW58_9BACT|nr:hypothetical protein [uncultured Acidobacteria bacterium HF4000_26D02]